MAISTCTNSRLIFELDIAPIEVLTAGTAELLIVAPDRSITRWAIERAVAACVAVDIGDFSRDSECELFADKFYAVDHFGNVWKMTHGKSS